MTLGMLKVLGNSMFIIDRVMTLVMPWHPSAAVPASTARRLQRSRHGEITNELRAKLWQHKLTIFPENQLTDLKSWIIDSLTLL